MYVCMLYKAKLKWNLSQFTCTFNRHALRSLLLLVDGGDDDGGPGHWADPPAVAVCALRPRQQVAGQPRQTHAHPLGPQALHLSPLPQVIC